WLDVDVAGAQLHSLFQEVVHRADHWRTAREVPQALDVVFAQLGKAVGIGSCLGAVLGQALVEGRAEIIKGGDPDGDLRPKHNFSGAKRGEVGRVGHRQRHAVIGTEREYQRLAQETGRERRRKRRRLQHVLQRDALELVKTGDLVGQVVRRELGQLPQFAIGDGLPTALAVALRLIRRFRARLQVSGAAKVLHELR